MNKLQSLSINLFLLIATSLLLTQCNPSVYTKTPQTSIALDSTYSNQKKIDELVVPYKIELDKEMNEVLVISNDEFTREKGKPETKLGNLVADLSMEVAQKMYNSNIDFSMLNFGGLRTSLPKGEITKGKIFELMPFENEFVVVTISKDSLNRLINYLNRVGGQPVSGVKVKFTSIGQAIKYKYRKNDKSLNTTYKILTSDYLANGGDNMTFFLNPINYEKVGIKLRNAIIQYCEEQHAQGKQLTGKIEGRIVYE